MVRHLAPRMEETVYAKTVRLHLGDMSFNAIAWALVDDWPHINTELSRYLVGVDRYSLRCH